MVSDGNAVKDVLTLARSAIIGLNGKTLDVVDVKRPPDLEYARHLARVVSKLSPLVGNMLEFFLVSYLLTLRSETDRFELTQGIERDLHGTCIEFGFECEMILFGCDL